MQVSALSRLTLLPALLGLALAGCSQAPTSNSTVSQEPVPPVTVTALPAGSVYEIDTSASELRILVMKGGLLSRFGHNHVIGGPVLSGRVVVNKNLSASGFDLQVDLTALEVDNPQWRQEEGEDFASVPSAEDIAATRDNMLGEKVLDVANYPSAVIQSAGVLGQLPEFSVLARVTLKDSSKSIPVPVRLELGQDRLTASGAFVLTQSDFGIEPLSILLGAISVQDDVRIRFRIVARLLD